MSNAEGKSETEEETISWEMGSLRIINFAGAAEFLVMHCSRERSA